jgi:hypothetical protein
MLSVRCSVTLLKDKKRKVEIEIRKEKDGKLLWNLIKSSGGNLSLPAPKGTWETNYGDVLSLWEINPKRKVQNLVMLVVFDIKQDFFDDIFNNGKTIASEHAGLYNDNPSENEVSVKLARMY